MANLTASQIYRLNKMNKRAADAALGTAISTLEAGADDHEDRVAALEAIPVGGALADGKIIVGNADGVAAPVSMSSDATIANTGALTIANSAINNAKVAANAAIAFSKLAALASAKILVGSAGNVATEVAVSGDATLSNAGALEVTKIKGITAGMVPVAGGQHKTGGGAAAEQIASVGVLDTDTVVVTLHTIGNVARTIATAAAGTDKVVVTFSDDPSTDHVVNWMVFRAVA